MMEERHISIPENRNYEYSNNQSYQLALARLAGVTDYPSLCRKSGSLYDETDSESYITLDYLSRTYRITVPDVVISNSDNSTELPLRERILILHYLLTAQGTLLSNEAITFKELPEGPVYFRTFRKRTIDPLVKSYGTEPDKLLIAATSLGGRVANYGDIAVTINAFRRVPVTLVLWQGDEEFPADSNILYDRSITDYLPTEDIIVLTETLVWKLIRA
jgi:hypothetical protein